MKPPRPDACSACDAVADAEILALAANCSNEITVPPGPVRSINEILADLPRLQRDYGPRPAARCPDHA